MILIILTIKKIPFINQVFEFFLQRMVIEILITILIFFELK
jgi:hypothetical protein